MQVKDLGVIYDEGLSVELPITLLETGTYQVISKLPDGTENTRIIVINSLSEKLTVPNTQERKFFALGLNVFHINLFNPTQTPQQQAIDINGYTRFSILFKVRDVDLTDFIYTNTNPITEEIGGYAVGAIFEDIPIADVLDGLFYKTAFSYFRIAEYQNTRYEVGIEINELVTFEWEIDNDFNVAENTIEISGANVNTASNLENIGSIQLQVSNLKRTTKGSENWAIQATLSNQSIIQDSFSIRFDFRQYWGSSEAGILNEAGILALQNNRLSPNTVLGEFAWVDGISGNDEYKYFVIPDSEYTAPRQFVDENGFGVLMKTDFPENEFGLSYDLVNVTKNDVTKAYRVYRTANKLSAGFTFTVKN